MEAETVKDTKALNYTEPPNKVYSSRTLSDIFQFSLLIGPYI